MSDRRRVFLLVIIMLIVALVVTGVSITLLYRAALNEEKDRLVEAAQSQARLIESVARFNTRYTQDYPGGPLAATLSQISDAHTNYSGFGQTGEFTLAKREDDLIIFLLRHRHFDTDLPQPVPFSSELANPMRHALSNQSGTMVGLDYRGETVLAAYEPVAELDMGIVAKIDLVEIQAPFFRAGIIAGIITLLVVVLGALLFLRITEPLLQNIRENEERLRGFMEAATESFFLFDKGLNYLMINKAGMGLFPPETRPKDLIGKNILDIVPSLKETGRYEQYKKVIETGEPFFVDDVVPDSKFGEVYLSIRAFKVGDGLGMLISDIAERKRAEEEKRRMESHLRQQQKLESIGTLASGVAHEINNPIMGIMNYATLISERLDPSQSQLREFADEIGHETERVAKIVRNLLTFSRQDKQSHSPARITDIVDSTLSLIRTVIKRDQITLAVDVPEDLPEIKCRSQQIQQVLMNLFTNARDALNARYPEYDPQKIIAMSVHLFEKEGRRWLRTTIEDHGAGIPVEIRERIFDPFYTTKDRATGTGLGLSISLGIVKDHHGELSFESEEKQPTRFHLDLPVDNGWDL